ncbi:MAG: hypothetical protein ACI9FG_000237 [Crocinitomicaceae bacterium]
MKELFELSLNPWVLPFTVMVVLSCVYWLLALLGTIDMDMFDVDLDIDSDADGIVGGGGGGIFASLLQFINATEVPLMFVISVMSLSKWLINIAALLTFNTAGIWWVALLTWVGGFFLSCVIAAIVTRPLVPIFKAFKAGEDDEEAIIGAEAIVVTSSITEEFGQVRVIRERGASAQVHCRLADGETPLKKGDTLRVIGRDEETQFYIGKKI